MFKRFFLGLDLAPQTLRLGDLLGHGRRLPLQFFLLFPRLFPGGLRGLLQPFHLSGVFIVDVFKLPLFLLHLLLGLGRERLQALLFLSGLLFSLRLGLFFLSFELFTRFLKLLLQGLQFLFLINILADLFPGNAHPHHLGGFQFGVQHLDPHSGIDLGLGNLRRGRRRGLGGLWRGRGRLRGRDFRPKRLGIIEQTARQISDLKAALGQQKGPGRTALRSVTIEHIAAGLIELRAFQPERIQRDIDAISNGRILVFIGETHVQPLPALPNQGHRFFIGQRLQGRRLDQFHKVILGQPHYNASALHGDRRVAL